MPLRAEHPGTDRRNLWRQSMMAVMVLGNPEAERSPGPFCATTHGTAPLGSRAPAGPCSPLGAAPGATPGDGAVPGEVARRRFLGQAAVALAAGPALQGLVSWLGAGPAPKAGGTGAPPSGVVPAKLAPRNPWPAHPVYNFAMISDRTDAEVFIAARTGANDASALFGTTYTWNGSATGNVAEMVDAFQDAVDDQVNGIACSVTDAKAFNNITDAALAKGIPVIAFSNRAPAGSGNNAMAYIGQDYYTAGALAGTRALSYLRPGETVAALMPQRASAGETSRLAGAASVLRPGGARVREVHVPEPRTAGAAYVTKWYRANPGTKFLLGMGGATGRIAGEVVRDLGLVNKGVHAAAFDAGPEVLSAIAAGHIEFTIDPQPYLQGFLPLFQLFLYNITGGLLWPTDVDTGAKVVSKLNVLEYLRYRDSWEGSSTTPRALVPPGRINLSGSGY